MTLCGIGIDLVSIPRIRKFLKQHSTERIFRLLSPSEKKRYRKRKISAQAFARIFTAKEAFFKTLNVSWMGVEGFSAMEISVHSKDHFSIKLVSQFASVKGPRSAAGCFFYTGKLLGAQVMRWDYGGDF